METNQNEQPYVGDLMLQCLIKPYDFQSTYAVIVTGAAWNPCGHMLLNAGGRGGWYFHIAERKGNPRFMREMGYLRYLREHKKQELRRTYIVVPHPEKAQARLEALLAKQWSWFAIPNNCVTFVEDVVQAGGSKAGLYSNCATREVFK
jgi:hypothetical protein